MPDAGMTTETATVPDHEFRVSVIIPSFNTAAFLTEAITSAIEQQPPPAEVLVQDGGSTDDTVSVLRSFGDRVSWVSEPDRGQSDALNRALGRATGDAVIWLNSDDLLVPGAIAAATAAFQADAHLAFAYGDYDVIDEKAAIVRRYRSSPYSWDRIFRKGCYIFSGALFIRREALVRIGAFDPTLRACMDLDLMLRLDRAGKSIHLGSTIGQFRIHRASKSWNMGLTFMMEGFRVRHRHVGRSPVRWTQSLLLGMYTAVVQLASPIRYSSWWPRHGRGKRL